MLSDMRPHREVLCIELHFGSDLAACDVMDRLQAFLRDAAARYSSGLRVLRYERDREAVAVDASRDGELRRAVLAQGGYRGETYKALAAQNPPLHERRFGNALVYGADRSMFLSVSFDQYVPAKPIGDNWLFSNNIMVQIRGLAVEGSARGRWALAMLTELGADPRVLWGAGFLGSEFRAKNLHDGPDGVWALGRDVRVSLPGLFWANVFGAPYLALIGRDRLTSAPAQVMAASENVLLVVHDEPEDWARPSAVARNKLVAGHIGAHYFFDRHAPGRHTRAPDFGLRPLPRRQAFQVLTSDGEHFTPLP